MLKQWMLYSLVKRVIRNHERLLKGVFPTPTCTAGQCAPSRGACPWLACSGTRSWSASRWARGSRPARTVCSVRCTRCGGTPVLTAGFVRCWTSSAASVVVPLFDDVWLLQRECHSQDFYGRVQAWFKSNVLNFMEQFFFRKKNIRSWTHLCPWHSRVFGNISPTWFFEGNLVVPLPKT